MMYHDVSWCIMMYHGVSWCIMVYHGVSWCIMVYQVYHGVSWCIMVYRGVSWCIMVYHGVSWCIMVYHGVSWCIMVYHGVSWWHCQCPRLTRISVHLTLCLPASQLDRGFTAVGEAPTVSEDAVMDLRLKYIQHSFDRLLVSSPCQRQLLWVFCSTRAYGAPNVNEYWDFAVDGHLVLV